MNRINSSRRMGNSMLMLMGARPQKDQPRRSSWLRLNRWLRIQVGSLLRGMIHRSSRLMRISYSKSMATSPAMGLATTRLLKSDDNRKHQKVKEAAEQWKTHRHSKVKKTGISWWEDTSAPRNSKKLLKYTIRSGNGIKTVSRHQLKIRI